MTRLILFIAFFTAQQSTFAQQDNIEIRAVIDAFFESLNTGDSTQMSRLLHPNIILGTTYTARSGAPVYQTESREELLISVGTPRKEPWDEQISNVVIYSDDNLAMAWMDYRFYFNEEFSHCGVNAFSFAKTENGWKILSIIDTRRKEPCELITHEDK